MRRVLNEKRVVQQFRCLPELGLVYLTNAKTASTTIMLYLMVAAARGNANSPAIEPHRRDAGPFIENIFQHPLFGSPEIRRMTIFSVVRNPFARTLSGYLSKIASGKTEAWQQFASQFGLRQDAGRRPLSFTEFVRLLETQPDERINAHFRPQYVNLLFPFSAPHFVGRLEQFEEAAHFLEERGVPVVGQRGRSTRSADRVAEHYTEEAEALVARKFAPDFELFGYSSKLAELRELREPKWRDSVSDILLDWLSGGQFPIGSLDDQARSDYEIRSEDDPDAKIEKIGAALESHTDWQHLEFYAKFVRSSKHSDLLRRLEERIALLRSAHHTSVQNREIFVSFAPSARSRAKARKAEKRRQERGTSGE